MDNEEEQSVGLASNDEVEPMEEPQSRQEELKEFEDDCDNTVDTDPFDLADLIARKCHQGKKTYDLWMLMTVGY